MKCNKHLQIDGRITAARDSFVSGTHGVRVDDKFLSTVIVCCSNESTMRTKRNFSARVVRTQLL